MSLESMTIGLGLGVLFMFIWASGCYARGLRDGESRAHAEWVCTASDPNRYVEHEGRHYFAHEFVEQSPELEIEPPEYREWVQRFGGDNLPGDHC